MNKKGFTLIELLAVIIVLGVIALIAVPIVSNVINESKEKAAKVSALNYLKAVEDKVVKEKLLNKSTLISGKTYQVDEDTELIDVDNGNVSIIDDKELDVDTSIYLNNLVKVKGNVPDDGYIIYDDEKIKEANFVINGLLVSITEENRKNGEFDVSKFSGTSNISSIVINNKKEGLLGGQTHQLDVTVNTKDGQQPDKKTVYTSSNTNVATISNKGLITAVNEGTTQITVKAGVKKARFILTVYNESLLGYVGTIEETGTYQTTVNGETYSLNVTVLEGNQVITTSTAYGSLEDCASGEDAVDMAKRMVVVKVKGDYIVNSGVTVSPVYDESYGGPKGFMLYVTGKLTNNGIINNNHGAYAIGQDVYLYKNTDNTYEYVPAIGAGSKADGSSLAKRATAGGGAANGASGTSYSGGAGGATKAGTLPSEYGGKGAMGAYSALNYEYTGGAGNPAGCSGRNIMCGNNGTGGLLIIYSNEYENNGTITAIGQNGGSNGSSASWAGAASGGGSINIFTNQTVNSNQLSDTTDSIYNSILGQVSANGGKNYNNVVDNNAAGNGAVNIGRIVDGQYYDLKQVINQDKINMRNTQNISGDSIISIVNSINQPQGQYWYIFKVNNEDYPVHLYVYDGDQNWDGKVIGDIDDCASGESSDKMAKNMVIAKIKGNLTNNGTIRPIYDELYGGPKGFMLYVTGTLVNNGTIDNSHGAYAQGQNVYLYKNTDNTYEYVPAIGASGGLSQSTCRTNGKPGQDGTDRSTGGGGSGGNGVCNATSAGAPGTSYSGGTGSGGTHKKDAIADSSSYGGKGGTGTGGAGGTGNPAGTGNFAGTNGTGGLLVIYANSYNNVGTVTALGTQGGMGEAGCNAGGAGAGGGGSSGGGSINIFYQTLVNAGTADVSGGLIGPGCHKGGAGGAGTVTYTQIN